MSSSNPSEEAERSPPGEDVLEGSYQRDSNWVYKLRTVMCPSAMVDRVGRFDKQYFKPKSAENLTWGSTEAKLLRCGIERFGVGHWSDIRRNLLPAWEELELKLKACRMLGIQDIAKYKGWKGTEDMIKVEHEKNKQIGVAAGRWTHGVLVNEDDIADFSI